MDDRGHWHDAERMRRDDDLRRRLVESALPEAARRPVIEIGIGETVGVVKASGETVMATFGAAEKNKVTLTPQDDGKPRPYLELAEAVQLQRASGESVRAQVWDNRKGKLILRTLPIG